MIDLLLINGYVITMDSKRRIIQKGAVAIEEGRIKEVGTTEELLKKHTPKEIRDCNNCVIMPGLIDAHGHGGHSLLKGVACGNDSKWMSIMTDTYKHYVTDEFWYHDARLAALERVKAGVTTGVSVLGSMPRCDDPIFAIEHAKGYAEIGIRDIVCTGPCNPPWPHKFTRWRKGIKEEKMVSFEEVLDAMEAVIETLNHSNGDKTRAYVAPFVIVTSVFPSGATSADLLYKLSEHDFYQARKMRALAEKYKTRIHSDAFGGMIHLAMQDKKNALLGPDVHLHHCTGLSFDEVKVLAETGTNVSCSPWNEYVQERTPVIELMGFGTTVAIGSDGTAPNTSYDMFQAMRKTQSIQQIALKDYYYLPPEKLLEMVTIDAAKCVGWQDELGSLEQGKKADVIVVDMDQPHLAPIFSNLHLEKLVYYAVGSDVRDTIVQGTFLMKDRKVLGIDEKDIMEKAGEEALETLERAGILPFTKPERACWGKIKEYIGLEYESKEE